MLIMYIHHSVLLFGHELCTNGPQVACLIWEKDTWAIAQWTSGRVEHTSQANW